jgi:hypothetical protein
MVHAPEAAFLIAAEEQVRSTVGTCGIDDTNLAMGIPKGNQVFTK